MRLAARDPGADSSRSKAALPPALDTLAYHFPSELAFTPDAAASSVESSALEILRKIEPTIRDGAKARYEGRCPRSLWISPLFLVLGLVLKAVVCGQWARLAVL